MLLDRADQAISSTELQKNARVLLDRMADGRQDRYVVMRDNRPTAVMLPTARYEALMAELEDLRIEAIARDRLPSIGASTPISHADMKARFAEDA
ncbi:MAG: type II toxin-antitoxin system Phd/YefM family antitoxin [Herminiimonas sp.]|nr:type II toxin-antitoxin system Phd/YefM family antitoxin [Herminiimonas sp.]